MTQEEILKIRQELYQSGYNDGYKHGQEDIAILLEKKSIEALEHKEKYNAALERARELSKTVTGANYEYIFPELKESEDEKIRKTLIELVRCNERSGYFSLNNIETSSMIAWLEKQSEQKTADKAGPKFHEGEWIIANNGTHTYQVREVKRGVYVLWESLSNKIFTIGIEEAERSGRLWTIQDANDGDVLLEEEIGEPFIYNGYRATYSPGYFLGAHCGIYDGKFNPYGSNHYWGKNSCPATNEQRDLLFQKMADAGYEWDADKKKLKKIEQKPVDKVGPKFHSGDWIVDDETPNDVFCVIEVLEEIYKVIDIDGDDYHIPHCKADGQFHLWTIADAKDGDVLWHSDSASNGIFVFKEIRHDGKVLCYCDYDSEDHFCTGEHHTCCWSNDKYIKPATKEQRVLLFSKMREAGYEWNTEKNELKKIEQNLVDKVWEKFTAGDWV